MKALKAFFAALLLISMFFGGYFYMEKRAEKERSTIEHAIGFIPAQVDVGEPFILGNGGDFIDCNNMFYSFWLSETALAAIHDKKLAYFDDALRGRMTERPHGYTEAPVIYSKWKETPTNEYFMPIAGEISCTSDMLDPELKAKIAKALRSHGSYYAIGEYLRSVHLMLVVLPELKIVMVGYDK